MAPWRQEGVWGGYSPYLASWHQVVLSKGIGGWLGQPQRLYT